MFVGVKNVDCEDGRLSTLPVFTARDHGLWTQVACTGLQSTLNHMHDACGRTIVLAAKLSNDQLSVIGTSHLLCHVIYLKQTAWQVWQCFLCRVTVILLLAKTLFFLTLFSSQFMLLLFWHAGELWDNICTLGAIRLDSEPFRVFYMVSTVRYCVKISNNIDDRLDAQTTHWKWVNTN